MRAERMLWPAHFECEFVWAGHCKYELEHGWALRICILWKLSFANVDFMRGWNYECELNDSWVLGMWILWELSFANLNFMRAEFFKCELYDSWVNLVNSVL